MAFKYTEDQLNKMDKALLIELFLGLQDQMEELTKETHALNQKSSFLWNRWFWQNIIVLEDSPNVWRIRHRQLYGDRWKDRIF